MLGAERLPEAITNKHLWEQRYEDINAFEKYLTHNGVVVRKFFLHLSKGEQKKRFLARLDDPHKNWKFSLADIKERGYWKDYQRAYEELIQQTATKHAPWYVVPADNKWYSRLVVSAAIVETLDSLQLEFPVVDKVKKEELEQVRKLLVKEKH
jgi:polyphosphate kinase 2 (PPK2 family)